MCLRADRFCKLEETPRGAQLLLRAEQRHEPARGLGRHVEPRRVEFRQRDVAAGAGRVDSPRPLAAGLDRAAQLQRGLQRVGAADVARPGEVLQFQPDLGLRPELRLPDARRGGLRLRAADGQRRTALERAADRLSQSQILRLCSRRAPGGDGKSRQHRHGPQGPQYTRFHVNRSR